MRKTRELFFSTFHMTDENMFAYYRLIQKTGFSFVHGHPSSVFIFADFLKRHGLSCPVKAVLATSEALFPFQVRRMEEVFRCRVFSFYGQSEQVALAAQCESSSDFHVHPLYGFTEILNAHGEEVTREGEKGEIVSTGFTNEVMPFIRYRTGDMVTMSFKKCSCGRNNRIIKRIEGRSYDYIVTGDGRVVSLTSLIFGQHLESLSKTKKIQIYQERMGAIEVRIEKSGIFQQSDEEEIRQRIAECVLHDLNVTFAYPESIPLSHRGKHAMLVQKIPMDLLKNIHR